MIKLVKKFNKLKEEMFEEFLENKGNDTEIETISNDYIKIIAKHKESVRDLNILFTDKEELSLVKQLGTLEMIAIFKYTKEAYEELHGES